FKSAVEVVSVDVTVIDASGKPVHDLGATDFALTVDGQSRTIASAKFIPLNHSDSRAAGMAEDYTSNVEGVPGRLIAIVVDRGSIAPVRAKDVFTAAARFVDRLEPADRVGVFSLPDGPNVEFTTAHDAVKAALQHLDGQATRAPTPKSIGIAEALEFERGNRMAIEETLDRECGGAAVNGGGAAPIGMSEQATCRRQVQDDAATVAAVTHVRARQTVNGLLGLLNRFGSSETPKTIVLISDGLVVDGDRALLDGLGPALASAHTTIYALKPEPSDLDASQIRAPQDLARERIVQETGLKLVTHLAGGEVFPIISDPDSSFARLGSELSGYYLLGFEPAPGDRDGKSHRISVTVRRHGLEVRSRTQFSVENAAPANPERVIAELLRSPAIATGLPFMITSYAFQDPDSPKIRLLVALEVDPADARGRLALGLVARQMNGTTAATFYQPSIETPAGLNTTKRSYFATLLLDPGPYLLKAAMVDEAGHRGSVERAVRAYMTRMGRFRATQLMIGGDEQHGATPDSIAPTVSGNVRGQLHAYMELFADGPPGFDRTSVTIEVVPAGADTIVDQATAVLQPTGSDPLVRAASASVPLRLLPEGQYLARATIMVGGQRVGTMTRPFRLERPGGQ
ncbi:MAG TPA: VWA domain-containing protein, partial [Vicinamibacterales bacterium]|nr:VWA domain-containing protein [Vicinamibacterales bacterium]